MHEALPPGLERDAAGQALLKQADAYVFEHVVLTEGMHSDIKIEFDKVRRRETLYRRTLELQALTIEDELKQHPDVIIGIPDGATGDAHRLRDRLGISHCVDARKIGHGPTKQFEVPDLRRPESDKRPTVLLVDDIATTWGSFRKMTAAVEWAGGRVVLWSAFADRSNRQFDESADLPKIAVTAPAHVTQWPAEECTCKTV